MPTTAMITAEVAACTDDAAQPESRRDGHRHGHPEPPGDRLDVQLVGLDMAQFDLPLKDPMVVELPGVAAGPVAPVGDGRFVEAEGGDDRLDRAAVAEQSDHEGHQVGGLLEPVGRGVAGGGEGPAAGQASVTAVFPAMDADVAEAELAPCGAVGVVAELGSAGPSVCLTWQGLATMPGGMLGGPAFFKPLPPESRFNGVLPWASFARSPPPGRLPAIDGKILSAAARHALRDRPAVGVHGPLLLPGRDDSRTAA